MTVDEYEFFGVETSGYKELEEKEKGVDKMCRTIMTLSAMFVACTGLTSPCCYAGWLLSFL